MNPVVHQIINELTEKISRRELIDFSAVLKANPQHAELLQQVLPTLQLFADFGVDSALQPFLLETATSVEEPRPKRILGDYQLIREVGRGGMGVVYEAEQTSLDRRVALKVLPFTGILDERHVQRFRNEARSAASLTHPNIVPVHAVGSDRGVHYYAMQFIEGPTLAQLITHLKEERTIQQNGPQGNHEDSQVSTTKCLADTSNGRFIDTSSLHHPNQRCQTIAEWGIQLAEALDYAHSVGVVHRDIKPGNVMLDAASRVWITDFGLARTDVDAAVTISGDLIGTLRYMSPEQLTGARGLVDQRSDIYSLGLTLYELLTLMPAFAGTDRHLLMKSIAEDDPVSLTKIDQRLHRDLETIVAKAIEKEPDRRYQTARDLAEDLRRFLQGKAVKARRTTAWDRISKWCRRNSMLVRLSFVFGVFATAILIVAGLILKQAEERAAYFQRTSEAEAKVTQIAQRNVSEHRYVTNINSADHAIRVGKIRDAIKYLQNCVPTDTQVDLRSFEWKYLWELAQRSPRPLGQHQGEVFCSCVSANGRFAATGGQDGARIWDLSTGSEVFHLSDHTHDVNGVSFSRDGIWLATASDDFTVKIWATSDGKLQRTIPHTGTVVAAVFLPDSQLLATAERPCERKGENIVRFWNILTWEHDGQDLTGHTDKLQSLVFSPDGKLVATASSDRTVRVWDVLSRTERFRFGHSTAQTCVCFANHHPLLACAGEQVEDLSEVRVWNVLNGSSIAIDRSRAHTLQGISFSPDDSLIATCGDANLIETLTFSEQGKIQPKSRIVISNRSWAVSFVDNKTLLTTARNGAVVQRQVSDEIVNRVTFAPTESLQFAVHPDGELLAVANRGLTIHRTSDGTMVEELLPPDSLVNRVTFSSDGQLLAAASDYRWILFCDLARKKSVKVPLNHGAFLRLAFIADNSSLLYNRWSGPPGGEYMEPYTGRPLSSPDAEYDEVAEYWFSPSTDCFAKTFADGVLCVKRNGQEVWRHATGLGRIHDGVRFSNDGQKLAACSDDGTIFIWDVESPEPEMVFNGRAMTRLQLRFTPDRKTLVGFGTSPVKLFNLATGRELLSLEHQFKYSTHGDFSRDGNVLAISGINSAGKAEIAVWKLDNELSLRTQGK